MVAAQKMRAMNAFDCVGDMYAVLAGSVSIAMKPVIPARQQHHANDGKWNSSGRCKKRKSKVWFSKPIASRPLNSVSTGIEFFYRQFQSAEFVSSARELRLQFS